MKPCRKQNRTARPQAASAPRSASQPPQTDQAAPAAADTPVRRYAHPIRTARPARSSTEELLSYILEALSRQSEQLDELLRHMEGDNSDTM